MECWHCTRDLGEAPKRIAFRAVCDHCSSWLHVCKNCRNYKPGLPNDCMIPGTELIADREACNFCEDFVLLGEAKRSASAEDVSRRLFGDDKDVGKRSFDTLFDD